MPSNQTMGLTGTLSSQGTLSGFLSNATLRGTPVEIRLSEDFILQWRYTDEDDSEWRDLFDLSEINYEALGNLPTLNGTELTGELKELFMLPADEISQEELNNLLNNE